MTAVASLGLRERFHVRQALFVGLHSGEIFGLCCGRPSADRAVIKQRVYRGALKAVKNERPRVVALSVTLPSDRHRARDVSWRVDGESDSTLTLSTKTPDNQTETLGCANSLLYLTNSQNLRGPPGTLLGIRRPTLGGDKRRMPLSHFGRPSLRW